MNHQPAPEVRDLWLAGDDRVWAIVWGPLAAIFFEWLPNWTAIRVYRTIKRGQFEMKAVQMNAPSRIF